MFSYKDRDHFVNKSQNFIHIEIKNFENALSIRYTSSSLQRDTVSSATRIPLMSDVFLGLLLIVFSLLISDWKLTCIIAYWVGSRI